ncbi:YrzI family small protein [Bacillus cereus group sp. TH152-1LC]|nr:YrzI family small protein [Bacillus cereus group sp. TH152-1LC]MDA1677833.1 YrzI family small protein [Bacillus cereus group sp. TH152-1LC]
MKFKAFFLTITIQKRKLSQKEILREQHIQSIMNEVKERQVSYYNRLF